jgi:hypothetical protein
MDAIECLCKFPTLWMISVEKKIWWEQVGITPHFIEGALDMHFCIVGGNAWVSTETKNKFFT